MTLARALVPALLALAAPTLAQPACTARADAAAANGALVDRAMPLI
jgi:hypothetical protein